MEQALEVGNGQSAARAFVLSEFMPYRLVALGRRISQALSVVYEHEDLTVPEWRTLAVIGQGPAIAARDVAALTPMDKMAVSRAVASLERKGLVERARDARDQRVRSLRLSPGGRDLFERISRRAIAFEQAMLSRLSDNELQALQSAISALERPASETRL